MVLEQRTVALPEANGSDLRSGPIVIGLEEIRQRLIALEAELNRRLSDWLRRAEAGGFPKRK